MVSTSEGVQTVLDSNQAKYGGEGDDENVVIGSFWKEDRWCFLFFEDLELFPEWDLSKGRWGTVLRNGDIYVIR